MYFSATLRYYSFFNKNDIGFLLISINENQENKAYADVAAHIRNIVDPGTEGLFKVICSSQQIRVLKLIMGFDVACNIDIYVSAIPGILTYKEIPSLCCKCKLPRTETTLYPIGFLNCDDFEFKPKKKQCFVFTAQYISRKKSRAFLHRKIRTAIEPSDTSVFWISLLDDHLDMHKMYEVKQPAPESKQEEVEPQEYWSLAEGNKYRGIESDSGYVL